MKFKLFQYEKHDDLIWERNLNLLKVGKYWLLNLCFYESHSTYGVEANVSLTYPLTGHLAGVWFNLGKWAVHAALLNEDYRDALESIGEIHD